MPKYVSYDEMMEILDNKYLLPFRKDERLRGLNGIDIVRCKDCKFSESVITSWSTGGKNNAVERLCKVHKWSVKDNDFCSHGEAREE